MNEMKEVEPSSVNAAPGNVEPVKMTYADYKQFQKIMKKRNRKISYGSGLQAHFQKKRLEAIQAKQTKHMKESN